MYTVCSLQILKPIVSSFNEWKKQHYFRFLLFNLFRIEGRIHFVVWLRSLLQLYSQLWQHLDHILASQGIYLNTVKIREICLFTYHPLLSDQRTIFRGWPLNRSLTALCITINCMRLFYTWPCARYRRTVEEKTILIIYWNSCVDLNVCSINSNITLWRQGRRSRWALYILLLPAQRRVERSNIQCAKMRGWTSDEKSGSTLNWQKC